MTSRIRRRKKSRTRKVSKKGKKNRRTRRNRNTSRKGKRTKRMRGGTGRNVKRVNAELFGKLKHDDLVVVEGKSGDDEFIVTYRGNKFYISIPEKYPFAVEGASIKINGFNMYHLSPQPRITDYIDNLISPLESGIKNTLIYCHPSDKGHWLRSTWEQIFGDDYKDSHKIYVDIAPFDTRHSDHKTVHTVVGDGFGDDILSKNINLWDFIMVPDCSGKFAKLTGAGAEQLPEEVDQDTEEAFTIVKRMLLNLKVGGQLWITKTLNLELIQKLNEEEGFARDDSGIYKINYLTTTPILPIAPTAGVEGGYLVKYDDPGEPYVAYMDFSPDIEPDIDTFNRRQNFISDTPAAPFSVNGFYITRLR